jgi:hypothetical protein
MSRWVRATLEVAQFWKCVMVLVATGELLGGDDVVECCNMDDEAADLGGDASPSELVVAVSATGAVTQLGQDVDRTSIGRSR